jgi:hypothetical protein
MTGRHRVGYEPAPMDGPVDVSPTGGSGDTARDELVDTEAMDLPELG